ncbi:MAG: phosphatidylglycerol lysyltransferase domain-containing protein [Candidatus Aminicenantales bacterium]
MTLPRFPGFKMIGLEDQERIRAFTHRYPSEACEINFSNIFIWRNFEHPKLTTIHENLCILCEPPSEPAYFLPPIGDRELKKTIATCLSFAPRLSRVPETFALQHCPEYRSEPDRNNFDYVYLSKDLAELRGKKYDGKRNRIKKFEKSHAYRYLRLTPAHLKDCFRLVEEWVRGKGISGWLMAAQKDTIEESLRHFKTLGLTGCAIEVDGAIAAFSIGEKLGPDTAVIHIEIVSPEYEGLSQLINREFIKNEWSGYPYINREQDIGLAGLRRAKLSYHPHHLVKKYNIWGK